MKHELRLYGPLGGFFGYTAEEIMDQIPQDATDVTLRIHSPGGSVGEGLAIYHALRDHKAKIKTIVDGYAASSASFVMLAGDEREVHRNSIVFVHNPWMMAEGNAEELRKIAGGLDVHAEAILDIYKTRTGMDEAELREMMDETAFFRGVDAKENGFATTVADDPEAEAQIAAMLKFEGIAAQAKEKTMSKQKTRKEIEKAASAQAEELENVRAQLDTRQEAHAAELEKIGSEHKAEIEAKDAKLAEVQVQLDETLGSIDEVNAKLDEYKAEIDEYKAGLEAANAKTEEQAEELEKAHAALKNPAVADACRGEVSDAVAPNDDAEADEAEAKAIAKAEAEKAEIGTYAAWQAIENAAERTEYYRANREAIIADLEKQNG